MKIMKELGKLKSGNKVAILSPSFAMRHERNSRIDTDSKRIFTEF